MKKDVIFLIQLLYLAMPIARLQLDQLHQTVREHHHVLTELAKENELLSRNKENFATDAAMKIAAHEAEGAKLEEEIKELRKIYSKTSQQKETAYSNLQIVKSKHGNQS